MNLFPIAQKVFAKSFAQDLVPVQPMDSPFITLEQMERDVMLENRKRKLKSYLNDVEYVPMKIEEHVKYKQYSIIR
jgi:hypothetical protein